MTSLEFAVPTSVADSSIAGRGVFTSAPIPRGGAVVRFGDAPSSVADFGWINHSCDPVLGWSDDHTLVALRDIDTGVELTTDYALALDSTDTLVWCRCDTYRCRQVIEGDDWRIPQLQQRYVGVWAPRIAKRIAALTNSA
jgi:hypothetical protein